MIYFAKVYKEKDGYYSEFPDLACTGSEGNTIEELKENSREALEGILESMFDRECDIPSPVKRSGKNWIPIVVDDSISIPIVLRQLRLSYGYTLKDVAEKLDVKYQTYQSLETLGKANPTIKTLRKLANIYEISLTEIFKDVA